MFRRVVLIFIALLLLGGCGTTNTSQNTASAQSTTSTHTVTTPAATQAESNERGYISQSTNEAIFVNWTQDKDNKLVGQLQVTDLTNSGIQSSNHAFNGIINGSSISLTITGSILSDGWTGKVFTGTLDGSNKLTLFFPGSNGMMNPVTFTSGTVADFNNEIQAFNNNYTQSQDQAKQAAQQKAVQDKKQEIVDRLSSNYNTLKQSLSNLPSVDYGEDIATMQKHFEKMQSDYNKLKQDASVVPLTNQQLNGVVNQDLNGILNQDLNGVLNQDLNGTISQDIYRINSAIDTLKSGISHVQSSYKTYNTNGLTAPFSDSDISSLIASAQDTVAKLTDQATSTQNQAKGVFNQGEQLFKTAQDYFSSLKSTN